jgi:hypothetical protein
MLLWQIDETDGFDTAWARLDGTRLIAEGRAAGLRPMPYWITYSVETADAFVTARVLVESRWDGGAATLDLRRDDGGWTVDGDARPDLESALDCDLAACPLTNTMPVLRHDLLRSPGDHHFLMAFIEVPSLSVVPSRQRYTHLSAAEAGGPADGGTSDDRAATIRYRSGSFQSDLSFDAEGFVIDYPQLGRRVRPGVETPGTRARGPGSARPDDGEAPGTATPEGGRPEDG